MLIVSLWSRNRDVRKKGATSVFLAFHSLRVTVVQSVPPCDTFPTVYYL